MASIVSDVKTVIVPVYRVELVAGVVPFVV
jgi:hypothetical protein